jgi:hypothetical protein
MANVTPVYDLEGAINAACGRFSDADSILLSVDGLQLHQSMIFALKAMQARDMYGIYVSLNRPHVTLRRTLQRASIRLDRLYFIDCVTALAKSTLTRQGGDVIYAIGPDDLHADGSVLAAVEKFVHSVSGEKFIIIDALRTLFIYNEPSVVSAFIHSLLAVSVRHEIKLLVLTRKEDDGLIKLVSNAFDDNIHI